MKSYFKLIIIFLFLLGIFLLETPSSYAGWEHNIRGRALTVGGAYEGNEYSLNFTSNTRVDIPFGNNYNVGSNSLTISMWVKPNTTSGSEIFASFGTNTDNRRAYFAKYNGKWDMGIRSSAWGSGQINVTTNWTHISIVFNSNNNIATMYVNGDYNIQHSYTNYNLLDNFKIAVYGNNSYQFLGKIDNTRIYSRALSEEEIDRLYRGVEISDDGLVGNWMLNEGSGSTASDSSGNNNHGTLVNNPGWSSDVPEIRDRYVYFNCLDEPTGSFTYTFSFPLGGDPCEIYHTGLTGEVNNYGVHLDFSDYTLSGYALHDEFGLISFRNGIPSGESYDFINNCFKTTSDDCNSANNCSACYDGAYDYDEDSSRSQRVYGWAYVIESGDWIKLHGDKIENENDRIKILDFTSSNAGDFEGFFYHENWGKVDLNECYSNFSCNPNNPKYKVYVGKLELAEMSAPHWGSSQACSLTSSALGARLRWKTHGGRIGKYHIAISNNRNYDYNNNYNEVIGQYYQHELSNSDLNWNDSYYWWLRLYDDIYEEWTEWAQFNHDVDVDIQGILTNNISENNENNLTDPHLTFTTYKHEWPRPYFIWDGHPDNKTFQAGAPNEFWVTNDARHFSPASPYTPINFDNPSFDGEFLWWGTIDGIESDKITIVDLSEFPEGKEPYFRLDATTISSTIENIEDGDKINQWNDETGNDNHVKQNDEDKRPIYKINALNGRPAVYFDGSSFMTNDDVQVDEQPFTIFVVAKSDDDLNGAYLLDSLNEDNISLGYKENKWLMFAGESLISSDDINHKLSIWRAFYSGEVSALKIIHETEEDPNVLYPIDEGDEEFTNIIEGISIGASKEEGNYWQGYIGEIIIYDELLNANERKAIEEYLSLKWGIDEKEDATSAKVYVYFESVEDNQQVWLKLTDPTGYYCSTSTPYLTVDFELPIWREIKAR